MKNKRMLVIPPIVLYIIWLILIPILFHGQEITGKSAIGFMYIASTVGLATGIIMLGVIVGVVCLLTEELSEWIKDGIPKEKPDPVFEEAEKEIEEILKEERDGLV